MDSIDEYIHAFISRRESWNEFQCNYEIVNPFATQAFDKIGFSYPLFHNQTEQLDSNSVSQVRFTLMYEKLDGYFPTNIKLNWANENGQNLSSHFDKLKEPFFNYPLSKAFKIILPMVENFI